MGYLLDTNAVIDYLGASMPVQGMQWLDTIVDDESMISIITKIETLGYDFKSLEEETTMEIFINGSTILDFNSEVVNKTIAIRKSKKIKLPDAIIAATAVVYDLKLVSRNTSDLKIFLGYKLLTHIVCKAIKQVPNTRSNPHNQHRHFHPVPNRVHGGSEN